MTQPSDRTSEEPEKEGLRVARMWAQWNLGDRYWADAMLDVYFNPAKALERLNGARAEYDLEALR